MESILLLEPSSTQKRQAMAQMLRDPQTAAEGDGEEITKRLRSLRTAAVEARNDLLGELQSAAKEQTSRRWFFAADAASAAGIIRQICPDTAAVAVNKSAVVTAEVVPFLHAAGLTIVAPYYDGLAEVEARFTQAWQVPEVPLAASRNAFHSTDDLPARRRQSLRERGARNLAAVIGVNALAAADGSAVLLQHRANIRQMLTECRRIILVAGIDKIVPTPADAHGIAYVPEDRKTLGLNLLDSTRKTVVSANLRGILRGMLLDLDRERQVSEEYRDLLNIKMSDVGTGVNTLSGGNQQKVVLGKWMFTQPEVLLLDEPTRGIDVGAKYEIYRLIHALADQGKAVVMVSSELPELLGMADRIYTLCEGVITGSVAGKDTDQETLMRMMTTLTAQ